MMSCGWIWMYVGAFLMLLEVMSPGFVIFFFGLSAMTVGLVRLVVGEPFTMTWQFAAFSGFSLVYLLFLRKWVTCIFSGFSTTSRTDFGHEAVGRVGKVSAAIDPPRQGRVVLGDSEWTAEADKPIAVGTDVRVVAQNNITMKVEVI